MNGELRLTWHTAVVSPEPTLAPKETLELSVEALRVLRPALADARQRVRLEDPVAGLIGGEVSGNHQEGGFCFAALRAAVNGDGAQRRSSKGRPWCSAPPCGLWSSRP